MDKKASNLSAKSRTEKDQQAMKTNNDDWTNRRLPVGPYIHPSTPELPDAPDETKYTTRREYEKACVEWAAKKLGLPPTSTRRRVTNKDGEKWYVSERDLDNMDQTARAEIVDEELVEVLSLTRSRAEFTDAVTDAADKRALLPGASVSDLHSYYTRHGRTPDGRVLSDESARIQAGYDALMALVDEAKAQNPK